MEPGDGPGDEGGQDPFGAFGLPFFGDLGRLLGGAGGDAMWQNARQLARTIATQGGSEANVEPPVRMRYEELGRVAQLHVEATTGLQVPTGGSDAVAAVTRTEWTSATIDAYRPVFDALGDALGGGLALPEDDPTAQLLGPLMQLLGPMTRAFTAGGLVGHLGSRAFGDHELPIPRSGTVQLIPAAIDGFASQWSLDLDALRLWVCVERLTLHAVLAVPHVGDEAVRLLTEYAGGFRSDPSALDDQLGAIDLSNLSDPTALQSLLGDPSALVGAMTTPEQDALRPHLAAFLGVLVGYVDHVLDEAGERLIGPVHDQLSEALRRRRVEASDADRFVEQLLGLDVGRETMAAGEAFVAGVIERAGSEGLARLWEAPGRTPTPNELGAPGLWLARIDLPDA